MTFSNQTRVVKKSDNNKLKREYIGTVVANNDLDEIGRIRVMIPELFAGIPTEQLPWIAMRLSSDGSFFFSIPEIGDSIVVYFGRDIYSGHYSTRYYMTPDKVTDFSSDYPSTVGFIVQKSGQIVYKLIINKIQESVTATHKSGTVLQIDATGNVTANIVASTSIVTATDLTITTSGKTSIIANADISINTIGKTDITSTDEINITGPMIKLNA